MTKRKATHDLESYLIEKDPGISFDFYQDINFLNLITLHPYPTEKKREIIAYIIEKCCGNKELIKKVTQQVFYILKDNSSTEGIAEIIDTLCKHSTLPLLWYHEDYNPIIGSLSKYPDNPHE
ncbi:hypothetical protein [Rickettsia endosymbiont of Halotydeus destructor]|uniref:hypothetical protein n=1 Tax=Rickettsia endosymbiont of Halotydeus destructor TaxID=2996754 RepID=UPI003BAE2058